MAVFHRLYNIAFLTLAVALLVLPVPSHAAVRAEDGQRLKTLFTQMIERYRNEAKMQGGDLLTEGDVMIEAGDAYFAITLPHITGVSADGSRVNFGMVSINALPGDKPLEWKMTVALPSPITMLSADGATNGVLKIGHQNFAGVFHETFRNFVRLNAVYKDITLTDPSKNVVVTVPEGTAVYNLKEGTGGLWSGPMSIKTSGAQIAFNRSGAFGKTATIVLDMSIKDYSVAEALAYNEKIEALLESYKSGDQPSISGPHAQGVINTLFDVMGKIWDGFGSTLTVKGVEVHRPATSTQTASTMKLESAGIGLRGSGFRSGKVTLNPTINMTNLMLDPLPSGYGKITPSTIDIDITASNLPFRELVELGRSTISKAAQAPETGNMAAMQAMMTAPQLLTNAGTTLALKNVNIGHKDYDVLLNGTATANMQALLGATGKARLEISGMEKLISYANEIASDPALPDNKKLKAQNLLQGLTMMQVIGQQGQNAKGNNIRSYDLELTADGKTLLNGADMQTIMPANPAPTP